MKQISFLPYLEIKKEFSFDNVILWPFWRLKSRRIRQENILKHLEWYFKKWRDNIFNKRLNITITSLRGRLLEPISDDERERIQVACNILFLLSVRQIDQFTPITSDNFTLYSQNFTEGEYRLAFSSGSYIRQESIISPKMVNKIKFVKPDYVRSSRIDTEPWLYDKKYYKGIQKAFILQYNNDWFIRLKRSLISFISSYSNVYSLSYFDRIVSLVTAIEILLDLKTSNKNKFKKAIKSVLGFSDLLCRRYPSMIDINSAIEKFSGVLYKKRSKYVHGEEMTNNDVRHPEFGEYYKTGVIFYYELVKSLLEKNNCLRRRIIEKKIYFDFFLFPFKDENQNEGS